MDVDSNTSFVIDASYVCTYLLPDEQNSDVDAFFATVTTVRLFAPELLNAEVGNTILFALRRNRIVQSDVAIILRAYQALSIQHVEPYTNEVLQCAVKNNLTYYDAMYAALTQKLQMPLLTLDNKLKRASKKKPIERE